MPRRPQVTLPNEEGRYSDDCAIAKAMKIIGAKWTMPIIWFIGVSESIHYADLKRAVAGITDAMLSMRLKELESCGIVLRESAGTVPPSVSYSLTETGEALLPALDALFLWSQEYLA